MQLRDWRKSKNLTQLQAALELGCTPNHYSKLERGKLLPHWSWVKMVYLKTNKQVTPNDLFENHLLYDDNFSVSSELNLDEEQLDLVDLLA